jgi:ribosome-associated protein
LNRATGKDTDLHSELVKGAAAEPHRPAASRIAPVADDIAALVRATLEDMKAENTVEIDLTGKTSLADSMFIASGRSQRHVGAIADRIAEALKAAGHRGVRMEGQKSCDWVLIDSGDVIVHIFRPEVRSFYNLEKLWGVDRPDERLTA